MQAGEGVEAPSSQYHGVTWDTQQKLWQVTVMTGRGSVHFGWYSDEQEAACAHDAAAVVIGPQAHLNFPTQVPFARPKLGQSLCVCVCTPLACVLSPACVPLSVPCPVFLSAGGNALETGLQSVTSEQLSCS